MKTILLLLTVFFTGFAVIGCTNDEGDQDVEILTPNDDGESLMNETSGTNEN